MFDDAVVNSHQRFGNFYCLGVLVKTMLFVVLFGMVGLVSNAVANPANKSSLQAATTKSNQYRVGFSTLGMSFKELLGHVAFDSTEEEDGYLVVYKNGKAILSLSDKNDLQDKYVWNAIIISPAIPTERNIHVGMSVKELLRIFPKPELDVDMEDNIECFVLHASGKTAKEIPDAIISFYVTSNSGDKLGNVKDVYPTKKYSTDGVIRYIRVLKTDMLKPDSQELSQRINDRKIQ